nr:DUF4214 domain-containing protein [uncultured Duganella sp.]
MKPWLPAASLAVLLAACGGGTESPSNQVAPKMLLGTSVASTVAPIPADYAQLVQNLYLGFFGRPADVAGLDYWSKTFSDNQLPLTFAEWVAGYTSNADIKTILDAFAGSVESRDLYVSNNASFINAVYDNGFNRYSEAGGRAYWAGLIDSGVITRAQAVLNILSAAQYDDAAILSRKTQAAVTFTSLLRDITGGNGYGAGGFSVVARDLLGRITATTDMTVFRAQIEKAVESLFVSDYYLPQVWRYTGYHYLQDMGNEPLYAASYRFQPQPYFEFPVSGSVTYGVEPQTVGWTRAARDNWAYAAPIAASTQLIGLHKMPVVSMFCSPVATANGAVSKSTDVLVAREIGRVLKAIDLANQRFTVYRENCAIGGNKLASFQFDANGAVTFPLGSGSMAIDASTITDILNGKVLFDPSSGKYLSFSVYTYARTNGTIGFFMVQHLGNHKTSIDDGALAVWSQE